MSRSATRIAIWIALTLACIQPFSVFAESGGTTRSRIAKFGDDLAAAWAEFPRDNQKAVRDQKIQDLNTLFNREVNTMDVPSNVTIDRALNFYIDNVNKSKTILKLDKMQNERTTYVTACGAVLRREMLQASDYKATRTTQQCFQLLLDNLVKARDTLHAAAMDTRQSAYQSINTVIIDLFHNAVAGKADPAIEMDKNIKAAREKFPTNSPDLESANRQLESMLETAAKTLEQQAMQQHR